MGTDRTLVVHGAGVDELPLDGTGMVHDVIGDGVLTFTVNIDALGVGRAPTAALAGGDAAENAAIIESIFAGQAGPRRDVVVLNAGAALVASGTVAGLGDGVAAARAAIDAGAPAALLGRLRADKAAATP
jgi:anthranilate phosphoribosyltransferase